MSNEEQQESAGLEGLEPPVILARFVQGAFLVAGLVCAVPASLTAIALAAPSVESSMPAVIDGSLYALGAVGLVLGLAWVLLIQATSKVAWALSGGEDLSHTLCCPNPLTVLVWFVVGALVVQDVMARQTERLERMRLDAADVELPPAAV